MLIRRSLRCAVTTVLAINLVRAAATISPGTELPTGQPVISSQPAKSDSAAYYWQTAPVGNTAQILTLFCHSCGEPVKQNSRASGSDIPLVSILRDTLGDSDPRNDRLLYVWLLSSVHPNLAQYIFSAMPFLYWRVGGQDSDAVPRKVAPVLDLTTPERSLVSGFGRRILQSSLLDPSATPIRATSRAYGGNESDYQRLRLEEVADYLRRAPVPGGEAGPSQTEIDTVVARIELRKRLLGGLVTGKNVAQVGAGANYAQERIRSRNWEVLRQCAERTGLLFEPLALAGGSSRYGILWLPTASPSPAGVGSLKPEWKLLNIRNPWTDDHLSNRPSPAYIRAFDENGALLPVGSPGVTYERMVPLGIYSLDYPTAPLLLVDFRNGLHIRRHEMTQRTINDVTAGVIGISHFSNWYYYVAADLYDFVVSRHGTATNQAARLDCYSQFRAALALDRELDPRLHEQIEARIGSLALNPLEGSPSKGLLLARAQYGTLLAESQDGRLLKMIEDERRGELAEFGESGRNRFAMIALHDATLGTYTHRVKRNKENLAAVDRERRVLYQLNFLDSLAEAGTPPEVSYSSDRVQASISQLNGLMPQVPERMIRAHAARTLEQLQGISNDSGLQANCARVLASLQEPRNEQAIVAEKRKKPSAGVAALISTAHPESVR